MSDTSHVERGKNRTNLFRLLAVAGLALALAFPHIIDGRYAQSIALVAAIYVIIGVGMHVILGEAGLLHLGYAAFLGVGAYIIGLGSRNTELSFWLLLPVAIVAACILGILIAFPTIRISGTYFVLATLAFGEIFRIFVLNVGFTGGPNGLPGIQRPSLLGETMDLTQLYYLTVLLAAATMWGMFRLRDSRLGRAWQVVREDELAAASLGIDTVRTKIQATAIGASIAGLAGALFAARQSFVSPESFTFLDSFMVVIIIAVGGFGSLAGVLIGVAAIIVLPEALRAAEDYRMLAFGVAIVLMMLLRPQGVLAGRAPIPALGNAMTRAREARRTDDPAAAP